MEKIKISEVENAVLTFTDKLPIPLKRFRNEPFYAIQFDGSYDSYRQIADFIDFFYTDYTCAFRESKNDAGITIYDKYNVIRCHLNESDWLKYRIHEEPEKINEHDIKNYELEKSYNE